MIIDCHAHLVPPEPAGRDPRAGRELSVDPPDRGRRQPRLLLCRRQADAAGFKTAERLPARLKWMDEQKIERQVVGGWLDMFAYEVPAEEGATWSRLINTHLAQTAKSEPRFVPLATVPLQDGARAAEVLREAHAAGFKGAMIGTQPKGKGGVLDDPDA